MQFGMGPDNDMVALNSLVPPTARFGAASGTPPTESPTVSAPGSSWFDLFSPWSHDSTLQEDKRGPRFIITESEDLT